MAAPAVPATSQRNVRIIQPIRTKTKAVPPLDYSFLSITFPKDVLRLRPRGQKGRKSDERYDAKCIKLNNNQMDDVTGLLSVMEEIILQPAAITWIDMSFNKLHKIDLVFCDFPSLQILYLHGNLIKDIKEVDKLAKLESLRKLALHGNLMDETKHYRLYVIYHCSQLVNFDMSTVTAAERETASVVLTMAAPVAPPTSGGKPKNSR